MQRERRPQRQRWELIDEELTRRRSGPDLAGPIHGESPMTGAALPFALIPAVGERPIAISFVHQALRA